MPRQRSSKRQYGTGSVFKENGSWHVKFYPEGSTRQKQKSLGRISKLSRKEAEKMAAKHIAGFRPPEEDDEIPSFAEVGALHIRKLESLGRKPGTTDDYWGILHNHLEPEFGNRRVDAPDVNDIDGYLYKAKRDKKLSDSTRLTHLSLITGIFKYAQKKRWRTDNPGTIADRPKIDRDEEIRPLSLEDFEAIVREIPSDEIGRVERVMYPVGAKTGLRRGELLAVRCVDVDFPLRKIRVYKNRTRKRDGTPKSGHGRWVPMSDEVAMILASWFDEMAFDHPEALVFGHPVTSQPLDESSTTKRFKRACVRAGVGDIEQREYKRKGKIVVDDFSSVRFHDLRHIFGTTAAASPDISLREIQEWMGHKDSSTTAKYSHFQPTSHAADRLGEAFARSLSNPDQNLREAAVSNVKGNV